MTDKFNEIRDRIEIVPLLSEYVNLKKSGINYKAKCPFHADKAPSFYVNPLKKLFYCFGCHVGGDVIKFVSLIEGISYIEAAKQLAEKAGIEWKDDFNTAQSREKWQDKEKFKNILQKAADYYHKKLMDNSGEKAREYLFSRGITKESIEKYNLGFALPNWDDLLIYLNKTGFSTINISEAGLIKKGSTGKWLDWLRDRIIIPIADPTGKTIAIAGRIFGQSNISEDIPKYLNTPETLLFHKSDILFGLNHAAKAIRNLNQLIIVEGYFDVIMLHQNQIQNVAAPMGTALTQNHCQLMRRYIPEGKVVLLFDGDEAGQKAIIRSHENLSRSDLSADVIILPAEHDADSFVRNYGKEGLEKLLEKRIGLVEFLITSLAKPTNAKDEALLIKKIKNFIEPIKDPLEIQLYIQIASRHFNIDKNMIKEYLEGDFIKNVRNEQIINEDDLKNSPVILEIFGSLLDQPEIANKLSLTNFEDIINDEKMRQYLEHLITGINESNINNEKNFLSTYIQSVDDKNFQNWMLERMIMPKYDSTETALKAIEQCITKLTQKNLKLELKKIQDQIAQAEKSGNKNYLTELLLKKQKLIKETQKGLTYEK